MKRFLKFLEKHEDEYNGLVVISCLVIAVVSLAMPVVF